MHWTTTPPTLPGDYVFRRYFPADGHWTMPTAFRIEQPDDPARFVETSTCIVWWYGPLPEVPAYGPALVQESA